MAIYWTRLQGLKDECRHAIYKTKGKIEFTPPLDDNEVRLIPYNGEWIDLWSKNVDALEIKVAEIREKAKTTTIDLKAPKKEVSHFVTANIPRSVYKPARGLK